MGAICRVSGNEYNAGNLAYMNENGIDQEQEEIADKFANEGKTPLFFAKDKKLIGVIAVADVVKASSLIKEFKDMGINVVMLTGDNTKTARAIKSN